MTFIPCAEYYVGKQTTEHWLLSVTRRLYFRRSVFAEIHPTLKIAAAGTACGGKKTLCLWDRLRKELQ